MKKFMQLILYPLIAVVVLFVVHEAVAQSVPAGNKPLVVLRFNQPNLSYDQQLYMAIEKAVAIKPSVMFDIVSVAPSTGNPKNDSAWQQVAGQHAQQVVNSLQNMGVPLSRMSISGQPQTGLTADEVWVYVR
jgi:hypothetical protein